MQFLLLGTISPSGKANPPEGLALLKQQEQAMAHDYYGKGVFRQIWSIKEGAAVICEANTREDMAGYVAELPMVKAGYLDVSLNELNPYAGFGAGSAPPRQD